MENKVLRIFKSTTAKILYFLLILAFIGGYFMYPNFYKKQAKKVVAFYLVYRGDVSYKKGNLQEAINNYQKALRYYPRHFKAQYNLANIFVSYEDYYSALDAYEKALKIKPNSTIARIDYAIVLAEATFNYDKAIEEYDKAIKSSPKWTFIPFINNKNVEKYNKRVALYNKGLAWRGKSLYHGDKKFDSRKFLENAANSYKEALFIRKNYKTYYNLGIVYHILKYPYLAGYNYCKAMEKEPLNYEAHYNLGILLRDLDEYSASLEEFRKARIVLNMKGDTSKNAYIHDILNDVARKISINEGHDELVNALNKQNSGIESHLRYKKGVAYLDDNYDSTLVKNLRNCAMKEKFEKNKDNTDIIWK